MAAAAPPEASHKGGGVENLLPKEMPGLRELPAYSCPPTYISPGLPRRLDETAKAAKEEMKKKNTMIMLMTID